MPWIADYLLTPLLMNNFTAFGRGKFGVGQAIHKLVQVGKVDEPKGSVHEQMKVHTVHAYAMKC